MQLNHLTVLLGFTTAAVVFTQPSVQAKVANYQIQSGTTSLSIDQNLLQSLGLDFTSEVDTTTPAAGFDFGFGIVAPSSDVLGTDFTFSYDDATSAFTPLSGTIEHTGSLVFDVDTTKLALLSPLEVGDFSIGFDSGNFFVRDTFSTGLRLFNLKTNSAPVFNGKNLVAGTDVLFSQEFSDALGYAAGYDLNLAGVKVGQAQISATAVPEPEANSAIAVLMAAGAALAIKRRHALKNRSTTNVEF